MGKLIKPHGSDSLNPLYVADDAKRAELQKEAEGLPKLLVCSQAAANAVMLASGILINISRQTQDVTAPTQGRFQRIPNAPVDYGGRHGWPRLPGAVGR